MTPLERSKFAKQVAMGLGFDLCGIASAGPISHADALDDWLGRGMAGTMRYLHRHRDSRVDLRSWLPGARSVIVVALNYNQSVPGLPVSPASHTPQAGGVGDVRDEGTLRGRVAKYAWGEDYHDIVREKLGVLVNELRTGLGESFEAKICVDTSAIVERELAVAAGIGWIGKNTLVVNESLGSFFFLGEIITDLELATDTPVADRCGSCTRCLDACPTGALVEPHIMDARRCISYLTIEHREEIATELAAGMGDWVYGCDVCQSVCPHNRRCSTTSEARLICPARRQARPCLDEILAWDEDAYRDYVRGRATDRSKLHMWKRNARIAKDNLMARKPESSSGLDPDQVGQ